jgi:DNA adenine methylase
MQMLKSPIESILPKPVLKWAGGKTQLLSEIIEEMPRNYSRYIEPFFGGGALFFNLQPENAIIADINPELINLYQSIKENPKKVIEYLELHKNDSKYFYAVRKQEWQSLNKYQAAARTIFLNRTCFNGLYRVNKSGGFNVPFGNYKNPKISNPEVIYACSAVLKNTEIILGDYKTVLKQYAKSGDFVFLDPPYLPISKCSDFKRYTKEQFYEDDHVELAETIELIRKRGCHVVLTNSNHPLVHKLFSKHKIQVIKSRRNINSNGGKRMGEDVIVTIKPLLQKVKAPVQLPPQIKKYPSTRYMGSKSKLLEHIANAVEGLEYNSVIDLFSGSGIVSYLFKSLGKTVLSNDYMGMCHQFTKAFIENNSVKLSDKDVEKLLKHNKQSDKFVQKTFKGIFFQEEENKFIDNVMANIKELRDPYKKSIARVALIRTCLKKRPRGIFTYVGFKYNDGRNDLMKSFENHFRDAVEQINDAVFDNGNKNVSHRGDAISFTKKADLVYIDPPYYSPLSDNEYVRRYHFVEGIAIDWKGVEIQEHTKTKKFKSYPSPFSTRNGAYEAFKFLFKKKQNLNIFFY